MISQTALFAAIISLAAADFNGAAKDVGSVAAVLSSKVAAWSSGDGLQGALGIQGDFPTLESAVAALSSSVGSVSDKDIDVATTESLAASIVGLLNGLTAKAGDFKAVGADSIVKNDIASLQGPAVEIVSSLVAAGKNDEAKLNSLSSALGAYANAFSSVDDAYGLSKPSFPTIAAAASSTASSSSSASASSRASSSASESASSSSSAEESSKKTHESHSKTKHSSESASASATGVNAASNSTAIPTSHSLNNGASTLAIGLGAGAIFLVGLLV